MKKLSMTISPTFSDNNYQNSLSIMSFPYFLYFTFYMIFFSYYTKFRIAQRYMILNFCSSKWNGEFRILEKKDIENDLGSIDIRFRRLRHVILRIRNAQFYQLLKLKSEQINKQFRIYFRRVEEKQGEGKCREYRRSRSIRFQAPIQLKRFLVDPRTSYVHYVRSLS